jgi:hypothetical protein
MNIESLHACAHCNGSGTCKSGADGASCKACVKKNELRGGPHIGLACGTCNGLGQTDSVTYRMLHRTQPTLAFLIIFLTFTAIFTFGMLGSPYFHEVMAFCTTMAGGVIGYYFSSRRDV